VTCNRVLRGQLAAACRKNGFKLRLAEPALCTDNAGMIAVLAERKIGSSALDGSLDDDILPNWSLADSRDKRSVAAPKAS
jgi:N6-L-threonylcarbamoyladenine synthase